MAKAQYSSGRGRSVAVAMFALLLAVAPGVTPALAIINGKSPAEEDTTYDAVGAFSLTRWFGLIPDHPNSSLHNNYGNATLIAPDAVILARHLLKGKNSPTGGLYTVRFRRNVEGGLGSKKDGPESYYHARINKFITAPGADLAIGLLDHPITHIKPIRMDLEGQALEPATAIVAGWGSKNKFISIASPRGELRVGQTPVLRREASPNIQFPRIKTELRLHSTNKKTGEEKRLPYVISQEVGVNMFDSGGAILIQGEDGAPRLIGVIITYSGGISLAQFRDDPRFPLGKIDPENPGSVPALPFSAEPPK